MLMDPEFAENIFFLRVLVLDMFTMAVCLFVFFKLYKMTFIKVISSDLNWNIFCLSVLSLKKSPCLQTFKVFFMCCIYPIPMFTLYHTQKGTKIQYHC